MQDPATTYVAAMQMQMQMQMQIEQGGKVAPQFPEQEQLRCPRCDSTNTKFCYYNNYNLSQPRHFCKACRRYWTKGGALRNIPVGGSSRKATKRSSSSKLRPASANAGPSGRAAKPKPEPADSSAGLELPTPAGTFTSLLVSDGQLGSLLDAVGPALPRSVARDSGGCWGVAANNTGTGGCGSDGVGGGGAWPDLAIFTRSSGFQL